MKSKEQKRQEAIARADETYSNAERFNCTMFLERFPLRSDYLRLFMKKDDAYMSFDHLNTMNIDGLDLRGYNREGIGNS